ncbi:MAG: copper resistance system multicopper oxidase [Alphaproteobacteria bacterium]|nr:MAG: copper resistance system multicopper oxidase [Alphaproteobacteria bacterium]
MISRRKFLSSISLASLGLLGPLPLWAQVAPAQPKHPRGLSGKDFRLDISSSNIRIDGRPTRAMTVNGSTPAPLLRWREGDKVRLEVKNHLEADSSIHWHGILLPEHMDGVPGVSFDGIQPGETFTYEFPVRQAGTYWYHSHSGLQEQQGHYGPIIIDPAGSDPVAYDREFVLMLGDWTFMDPHELFRKLKLAAHDLNYNRRTLGDFFADVGDKGFGAAFAERHMWQTMRMSSRDIADVTGETYTYLINGHGPGDNWTMIFTPGERIRLRVINAAAMTLFNFRIPGLTMEVVQADGQDIVPVPVEEFQIGPAETYDVIVTPTERRAFTVMCESIDRSGFARATLTPELGMTAPVPPLREPPELTMRDMGMDHGAMDHGAMNSGTMDHSSMDHSQMGHSQMDGSLDVTRRDFSRGPGVANLVQMPGSRLSEPGIGLENVGHRVLTYADLKGRKMIPDMRAPGREIEIHLTSNMERYMWSFDGKRFSEVVDPILFHEGERLRMTLVNDTMMPHPIHLHGMFFEVVNGHGHFNPRKHTIVVKPAEKVSLDITADEVGDWAFHCHLMYHMHAGMFQVVRVEKSAMKMDHKSHQMHDMKDMSHGPHKMDKGARHD